MADDINKKLILEIQAIGFKELAAAYAQIEDEQKRLAETETVNGKKRHVLQGEEREERKMLLADFKQEYKEKQRAFKAEKGSLNELRALLIKLQKDQGDRMDRGSKAWYEQAARINEVRDEVAKLEGSYGSFQRNVGNYQNAITGAFQQMGGTVGQVVNQTTRLSASMKGLGAAGLAMGGVFMGAVAAFKLIQGAIERSADKQLEWNIRTERFKQIWYDLREEMTKDAGKGKSDGLSIVEKALVGLIGAGGAGGAGANAFAALLKTRGDQVAQTLRDTDGVRKELLQSELDDSKARLRYEQLMTRVETDRSLTARQRFDLAEEAEQVLTDMVDDNVRLAEKELKTQRDRFQQLGLDNAETQAELNRLEVKITTLQTEQERRIRRAKAAQARFAEEDKKQEEAKTKELEKQLAIIEKIIEKELSKITEKDVKLEDPDIDFGPGLVSPLASIDARVVAERTAAQQAADAWKQSYAAQMEALEQAKAAMLVTEEQYNARKQQLNQQATDMVIGGLKQAVGANAKAQQAILLIEQIVAVKRAFLALKSSTVAVAEGTAQTAKIGFPQNIVPLAMFAVQIAGIIAQVKSAIDSMKSGDAGLSVTKGFSEGGYTGSGGKNEPAGIVHRGEVVWSQRDVALMGGASLVNSLRPTFKGYAAGGIVGVSPNVEFKGIIGRMQEMMRRMQEIPVVVSAQDISLKQNEVRKIRVRGDL